MLIKQGIVALSNVTISNVRGPDIPLYMAGARLVLYLPVSIAFDNLGLNVTGFSYHGTLWVCFVSCRKMMPDPDVFGACLKKSFVELVDAAVALGATKSPPVRARKGPTAKGKKSTPRKIPSAATVRAIKSRPASRKSASK